MTEPGILQQVLKTKKVNRNIATHFVLCNGALARYLIDVHSEGKRRLARNISAYSGKLAFLMDMLNIIPFEILKLTGMGYYAEVKLNSVIDRAVKQTSCDGYNVIIGTYDEKQKLVFQCFQKGNSLAKFIKVGNLATDSEMRAEINFLQKKEAFKNFSIPQLLNKRIISDENPFNIQTTQEFVGKKVEPFLTDDIVKIYKEISRKKKNVDENEYEFSHGDFAPWNIKKTEDGYVVFDWEHCGYRVKGFDLMHYCVVIKVMLEGIEIHDAFNDGLAQIKMYIPEYEIEWFAFFKEYQALRLE